MKNLDTSSLGFGESEHARAFIMEDPTTDDRILYKIIERDCNRGLATSTTDKQKHNVISKQQKEYQNWIAETDEHYMPTKRPLQDSTKDQIYI